ncbi:MAG: hypothetical protein COU10_00575 [Candidatus Harrisonbacteria bacterium CG10_big_fil_rev_8_21_14_0_10_45_28]|uniref:Uncharacterized protein n=1 Tax=Candidatus Harrisonbacteria bacterium CG10_big_fil_rev_8_21_14_0_10_45_28 TaxID=1974586 RepID=A0A2H0UP84_9BACT|nr:MAG: hypothetical protein COU10_00575 [Candidatus Harrisonbacteria bacterium CG10_big_fil_rev_8_21_14_0_10_45_28]
MSEGIENFKPEDRWGYETAEHGPAVVEFLKNYRSLRIDEKKDRYDEMLDLHCSGENSVVLTKISKGAAKLIEVLVFYKDDKIETIKAIFDGEGTGNDIEFFFRRRALVDLFKTKNAQA